MNETFDSGVIADNNWRQGAILGADLALLAFKLAPKTVSVADGDLLVLTSHDCDIVNFSIDKEPVVEVLRATARASTSKIDKQQSWGRNPRQLELATEFEAGKQYCHSLFTIVGLFLESYFTKGRQIVISLIKSAG